jgi:hypothetical protein
VQRPTQLLNPSSDLNPTKQIQGGYEERENQIAKFRDTFWSLKGADGASLFLRGAQIPMYSTVFDWTNAAAISRISNSSRPMSSGCHFAGQNHPPRGGVFVFITSG